ncbi:MBL fold metallo-hydrolase [Arthrobacter sp. ov407]|uniref:MBL fold metallo-hydrolase n=1 Tax=Arthrobacter sp. ov407 TaxID=1761748 RepID=UPI000B83B4D8|nr:MBL fold metallo-hydrolase [Arthrobacter sp. ov407]
MMDHSQIPVEPVIQELRIPAGMAGPVELTMDVRCFVVPHTAGVLLIDAGPTGSADAIGAALVRVGAGWSDITDVVLTHWHPDHVGGLGEVVARSPRAAIWAGAADCPEIRSAAPPHQLLEGDKVRNLRVLQTPGHTAGHISLLHDDGMLFVGDALGTVGGAMGRAPEQFTADSAQAEESLRKLSLLEPDRMLFSHGPEIPDPVGALRRLLAIVNGS